MKHGFCQTQLYPVSLAEDVIFLRRRDQTETILTVCAFKVDCALAHRIVDGRLILLSVVSSVSVEAVTDHDAFDYEV